MSTMPHATEEQGPAEDDGLAGLVTADSRQLLDLINQLRDLGVNKWVELPKIIVVGDQNSGKSSVLEAISRLTFPSSDGLCTTFATRLTLLREAKKAPMVRIEPSRSHSPEIQDQLRSYIPPETSTADFASVVLDAKKYIIDTVGKKKDSFLEDELIIETSSPDFPPVTLVDLPGIIQTANEEQQDEDVRIVKKMVTAHMKEEKSIILAVISAQYGVAIQQVLGLAKELDPQGERTLGIITKPDILREGSEPHDQFLRIAANQVPKYHLSLGWHVVRNLDSESRKTGVDRDTEERKWLDEHPAWENTVGVGNAGIETLRNRLAGLLEEHTRRSLPEVINAIREHLDKCRADLQKLGDSRETPDEQRRYLTTVSEQFKRLVELANDGVYHRDKFFEIRKDASGRIRASVQTMNKQFAHVMRSYGHNMQLPETASIIYLGAPAYFLGALKPPEIVGREKCVAKVNELNANSTGKELDGMPNVEVVRELFRFKAKTWQQLAEIHLHEVWSLVRIILSSMIRHVANESTAQRIFRNIINEELDRKKLNMATRLQEILAPHLRCHPISYNPALKDRVQLLKEKPGGESYPELSTLQQVDAYYQISLDTFIDNVTILVVEMCLVDGLPDIFTPSVVARMSDFDLNELASESSTIKNQRHRLREKESLLGEAYRQCRRNAIEPARTTQSDIFNHASPKPSPFPLTPGNDTKVMTVGLNKPTFSSPSAPSSAPKMTSPFSFSKPSTPNKSGLFGVPSSSTTTVSTVDRSPTPAKTGFFGVINEPSLKSSGKSYPLSYHTEEHPGIKDQMNNFQSITSDQCFQNLSFEELRLAETEILQQLNGSERWLAFLGPFGKMLEPGNVQEMAECLAKGRNLEVKAIGQRMISL